VGGVVLESNQYFIDASIATQLDEMWRELMEPDGKTESPSTTELDPTSEN
jgi:flagellar biosynthesis/type III secretory pathway protein FliH